MGDSGESEGGKQTEGREGEERKESGDRAAERLQGEGGYKRVKTKLPLIVLCITDTHLLLFSTKYYHYISLRYENILECAVFEREKLHQTDRCTWMHWCISFKHLGQSDKLRNTKTSANVYYTIVLQYWKSQMIYKMISVLYCIYKIQYKGQNNISR